MIQKCAKCKGVLNFWIDGRTMRLQSDGDVTVFASRQSRTELYDGEFTAEERNPKISAVVVVPIDVLVTDIAEWCDAPFVLQLCDGREFSCQHASNVSDEGYDAKKNLQPIELICDSETFTETRPQASGTLPGIGGGLQV